MKKRAEGMTRLRSDVVCRYGKTLNAKGAKEKTLEIAKKNPFASCTLRPFAFNFPLFYLSLYSVSSAAIASMTSVLLSFKVSSLQIIEKASGSLSAVVA